MRRCAGLQGWWLAFNFVALAEPEKSYCSGLALNWEDFAMQPFDNACSALIQLVSPADFQQWLGSTSASV